ncbi:hypothetical protein B9Z55_028265 [Caenorhabditis nigoni]|nr:hypothetical protein B9Z55_028265 [Caenorhabditis nigoni]
MAVKTPPRDRSHSPHSERHVSDHSDKENEEPEGEPQQVKQSKKDKSKAKTRPHESGDHSSGNSKKNSKDQEEFSLPSQGPLIPPTLLEVQQEVLALEDQVAPYNQANTWQDEIGKLTAALTTAQEQNATLIEAIHKKTGSGVKIVECIESKPILNAGMTTLEVNMAEIKQTQNTIISSINVMQGSIGKLEQKTPSKSKTILAHADQFASRADGLVLTSVSLTRHTVANVSECHSILLFITLLKLVQSLKTFLLNVAVFPAKRCISFLKFNQLFFLLNLHRRDDDSR